ncbi:uncharacterized protein LOC119726909 [Patiria miniata]|uniref:Integrase catalytic domain-containing protein n=1 Tax=Patiria miniata TaxID=46514 RepID=A0A913ZTZ8_PATMI|nr:uncharacterized protein LOC119726909 [Patiria miniata]
MPASITTDRGRQFESALFTSLTKLLGSTRIRTTSYNPQSNGVVERFHCQLKASLKSHLDPSRWTEYLPITLLGIRATVKSDIACSPAELVYGTSMRLPGQFVDPAKDTTLLDCSSFVDQLQHHMAQLSPARTRVTGTAVHIPKDLQSCTHVYVRCDAVRKPLQPPYNRPFLVLGRNDKHFTVSISNKREQVSIDRLKVAYTEAITDESTTTSNSSGTHQAVQDVPAHANTYSPPRAPPSKLPVTPQLPASPQTPPVTRTTKSGRHVRWPKRYVEVNDIG